MFFSIYVGNIPLQLTEDHLRQLFEPFGCVISAAVVQKTEEYKYGFVNFESADSAARALVTMNGKMIGGKSLQVKPANTDMQRAVEITQAADYISQSANVMQTQLQIQPSQLPNNPNVNLFNNNMNNNNYYDSNNNNNNNNNKTFQTNLNNSMNTNTTTTTTTNNNLLSLDEAERILSDGKFIKVWKVQYGDDWHEYDMTLAAIVEQLNIGEQIQITLSDSDYIITRLDNEQALQQNLSSGTTRKAIRTFRPL